MLSWKINRNSFLFLLLLSLLSLYSTTSQTLVLPVSEDACARCCTFITFDPNNEIEQQACQQAGCRGSQVNLDQSQAACANIFGGFGVGRLGCEIGRDFRFEGFSLLLNPNNPLLQCTQAGDLIQFEPPVGPPILTNVQCSTCCTQLDNGFDLVAPDDFAVEACSASCTNNFFCDNDLLSRNRLGCAIGMSFLTEGKVLLRETNRLFTCNPDGLIEGTNSPTTSPTSAPTRSPTRSPVIPTSSPTRSPVIPTNSPTVEDGENFIVIVGVSISVSVLLLGIVLGLLCRPRPQPIIVVKSDGGSVFGSTILNDEKKGSGQNLTFYDSETTNRTYPAPLYFSYDGTVSALNNSSASGGMTFSDTALTSVQNGRGVDEITVATPTRGGPPPPPKTPMHTSRSPNPPPKVPRQPETSF